MATGDVMQTRRGLATAANALTLARLAIVPFFALAVLESHAVVATALLALAITSDFADGTIARRRGETSALGGFLDHAADATLCTVGLAALASRGEVPGWLAPLVAAAFAQYALDSRALAGRPLRTSRLGRWNGIAYYVLVAVPVVRDALGLGWPGPDWTRAAGVLLVVSTLVSMGDRLLAWRRPAAVRTPSRTAPDSRAAGTGARSPR
jgi:cardiolipin synthase